MTAAGSQPQPGPLESAFRELEDRVSGFLGVHALNLKNRETLSYRAAEWFPMMSVAKLPVAMKVMMLIEARILELNQLVRVDPGQFSLGNAPINRKHPTGFVCTVRQLLEWSIVDSDNTAHDALFRLCGGPINIQPYMDQLRAAVRIARTERQQIEDFEKAGLRAFEDGRDCATPAGLVRLFEAVEQRELISSANIDLLIDLLTRTPTGASRIKLMLPRSARVYHKTGSGGDKDGFNLCTNDAGVFRLDNGTPVAIAVLVKHSRRDMATREAAIARAAFNVYQHWNRS
jgi:beta-lactamase class A